MNIGQVYWSISPRVRLGGDEFAEPMAIRAIGLDIHPEDDPCWIFRASGERVVRLWADEVHQTESEAWLAYADVFLGRGIDLVNKAQRAFERSQAARAKAMIAKETTSK